jgi:hypothetical protein
MEDDAPCRRRSCWSVVRCTGYCCGCCTRISGGEGVKFKLTMQIMFFKIDDCMTSLPIRLENSQVLSPIYFVARTLDASLSLSIGVGRRWSRYAAPGVGSSSLYGMSTWSSSISAMSRRTPFIPLTTWHSCGRLVEHDGWVYYKWWGMG